MTERRLTKIKAGFGLPQSYGGAYDLYVKSIQALIENVVPASILPKAIDSLYADDLDHYYEKLNDFLPYIHSTECDKSNMTISVTVLCSAQLTHGVGRFMCDLYSTWLVPGKQLPIVNTRSVNFQFELYPGKNYYLSEIFLLVPDPKDMATARANLPTVTKELKIDIMAVQQVRSIVSIKPFTLEQKKILLQENISSLLDRSMKEIEPSLYDHVHQLIVKASAEEKVTQIKDQLRPLNNLRPTTFDRDIYVEIQKFVSQLKDTFIVSRELKHLNRIVSYHYIFRKLITNSSKVYPKKRVVSVKILRTRLTNNKLTYPVLGVLIGINLFSDNEIFEDKHLFKAIQSCLPHVKLVKDSIMIERRGDNHVKTLYLEIEKPEKNKFNSDEIKELQKNLTREIKNRIESLMHPVFVHRNEEEVMRNILDLSKQLKYVHDLPQVIVNFHKQTGYEISFIVILLRLAKPQEKTLKEVFSESNTLLKFFDHDVRMVGILRKRYPKEANVFEVRLDKKQFLRKDFSLDLYKARMCIVSEITRMIGDVRDYNGGMIAKQHEVLNELKQQLLEDNIRNDFLLENFFYSLTPHYMQSLLSPHILKQLFLMLLEVLDHDFNKDIYFVKTKVTDDYYMMMLGALQPTFKELIIDTIDDLLISAHEISHSFVNVYDISCVGFLLKYDAAHEYEHFESKMLEAIKLWEGKIKCNLPDYEDHAISLINQYTT